MAEYFMSDSEQPISEDELRVADRETQLDVMKTWFRQHFEDPAERTPYESAEGGYIWIWGGPYDAREEIEDNFSGLVPDDVILDLVNQLEGECLEWAPTPSADDYDNYLIEDIASITEYYHSFSGAILDIETLLNTKVDNAVASCLWRLLYVNVITALETYLSDGFINTVVNKPELMKKFIETTPAFKAEKVPLSEVFKAVEEIRQKARSYLVDIVWHHIERIKPMFLATLGIKFPDDAGAIFRAILIRHDIVHRNGKTRDGEDIRITPVDVTDLIGAVKTFVQEIDTQLSKVRFGNHPNTEAPPEGGTPLT